MAFVQLWVLPVTKISAQSDIVWLSYCPPKTQKWAQIGPEPKKQWFLLAKATFCVRICEWPIDHWWQCRPNLGPKNNFWLNFPWILWFFWDLGLTLSIIPKDAGFAEILDFSNIFGFPEVNWANCKMAQNGKL